MMDGWQPHMSGTPLDGAPLWVRALQAGIVGMIAGLTLYAIMSLAVVQADNPVPAHAGPKECKKSAPAKEVVAPPSHLPAVSSLRLATPALEPVPGGV